jgi:hypothetical protein
MQTCSSRLALIAIFATWSIASASVLSFSGDLRTDATVLDCGPGCTLTPASPDSDFAQWAAAVYSFSVPAPSLMQAVTVSYADGGFEPYLSLFDGSGNFLASTFFGTTCPPGALTNPTSGACFDVLLDGGTLGAGTYQIAISAFENFSFAENFGSGTLADGFTGLGNLAAGEDLDYAFNVTLTSTSSVPEPSGIWFLTAAAILGWLCRLRKQDFKGDR